jgi:hypothetical protein
MGVVPGLDIWHNASSDADLEARLDVVEKNLTRYQASVSVRRVEHDVGHHAGRIERWLI